MTIPHSVQSAAAYRDGWFQPILTEDYEELNNPEKLKKYGYKSIEELVRWRLYNRTGGGLMAELGSHQLDACSIFLGKKHPLAVTGIGGNFFYNDGREVDDHVFVNFEFPLQVDDQGRPAGKERVGRESQGDESPRLQGRRA